MDVEKYLELMNKGYIDSIITNSVEKVCEKNSAHFSENSKNIIKEVVEEVIKELQKKVTIKPKRGFK